ncbi:sensor domain-containing phosphodiesterase [Pseudaminobacter sp. NGMCC 1.201702]|uniref:sensor domain-containing phosphodiesterase n=1 Tax=Pseudaminobacter sp. NGMCC 1.201702 TaxID=3391825 RepID=UPI0039F03C46
MIATGASLQDTTRQICLNVDSLFEGASCCILKMDAAGRLHVLAAPRFTDDYRTLVNGMATDAPIGVQLTQEEMRTPAVILDMRLCHCSERVCDYFATLGLKACWVLPVTDVNGHMAALFVVHLPERREPTETERAYIENCAELCGIAIQKHERVATRERGATVDALTGLPNRFAFNTAMSLLPCDTDGSWALFLVDLDNLKLANDTFGHLAGDALIKTAARRIAEASAPDRVFRLGGDEFGVIIERAGALFDLDAVARWIIEALDKPADCAGHMIVPRATIGGAVFGGDEQTAKAVIEAADFALYHAKETGRGGFVRYWPGIGTRMTRQINAVREVSAALDEGRIEAHYQPIVRLDTGGVEGFETLCRIRADDGALIPASEFREATSDVRVAADLTRRMLELVARDLAGWRDQGLPIKAIGLNLSAADFHVSDLDAKLEAAFGEAGFPPELLVVEIDEAVHLGRRDPAIPRQIGKLRARGVRVAIHEFGGDYASLAQLINVPVDIIKVGRGFISQLGQEGPGKIVVGGLIDVVHRLGIEVIGEGIETAEQAQQLWAMGCRLGQGFAFASAMNSEAAADLLAGRRQIQAPVSTMAEIVAIDEASRSRARAGR